MPEIIRMGGLEPRFLHSKEDTDGNLDMFEMSVQPSAPDADDAQRLLRTGHDNRAMKGTFGEDARPRRGRP
jgi:hypothetical protein